MKIKPHYIIMLILILLLALQTYNVKYIAEDYITLLSKSSEEIRLLTEQLSRKTVLVIEQPAPSIPVPAVSDDPPTPYTNAEIELMARVVMSEASTQPFLAKQLVAETILNRVNSTKFPDLVDEVVIQQDQFSIADNGEPTQECFDAVIAAIEVPCSDPEMLYFRDSHYFSGHTDYCQCGNLYFSTTSKGDKQ